MLRAIYDFIDDLEIANNIKLFVDKQVVCNSLQTSLSRQYTTFLRDYVKENEVILDFECSHFKKITELPTNVELILKKNIYIHGIDRDDFNFRYGSYDINRVGLNRNVSLEWYQNPLRFIDYCPASTYDTILFGGSYSKFTKEELTEIISCLPKLLKPGGRIVFIQNMVHQRLLFGYLRKYLKLIIDIGEQLTISDFTTHISNIPLPKYFTIQPFILLSSYNLFSYPIEQYLITIL